MIKYFCDLCSKELEDKKYNSINIPTKECYATVNKIVCNNHLTKLKNYLGINE